LSKTWKISAETPRAKKKEETRQRILKAASDLFETKGFYETTTSDIAKAAKVSAGSIYAHFGAPGKIMAELHKDLVSKRTENLSELRANWPANRSAWELLLAMLDELWGGNKKTLRMENLCAYQSWSWVCALSPEIFAEQHKRFMRQVHAIFRVPQDQTNVDAA